MSMCAWHVQQLGGESPLTILIGEKVSEAQGRHREVGSEGRVEQTCVPTYRNQIRGGAIRTSGRVIAKSIPITIGRRPIGQCACALGRRPEAEGRARGLWRISGGDAWKAVELTQGDLAGVPKSGLRGSRGPLTADQKSAEGIVREQSRKAREWGPHVVGV
jgi:hypothetical protein